MEETHSTGHSDVPPAAMPNRLLAEQSQRRRVVEAAQMLELAAEGREQTTRRAGQQVRDLDDTEALPCTTLYTSWSQP